MARTEIRVTVLSAEDLKKEGAFGKMSVYSLVWIDPAMKQSTHVHHKGGRFPEWSDELVFSLGENVLLFPHSALTIQVVSQGRKKHKLLGSTYLPLAEIARMKAMKENPEESDRLQLQLTTPSGHVQGFVTLSISLIDTSARLPTRVPPLSNQATEPVMGYPVGLPPNMAYCNPSQFYSSPYELHQQGSIRGIAQTSTRGSEGFPVPTQPAGAAVNYPRNRDGYSAYVQAPQPHSPSGRHQRGNIALALLGGAIGGLLLGDIIF